MVYRLVYHRWFEKSFAKLARGYQEKIDKSEILGNLVNGGIAKAVIVRQVKVKFTKQTNFIEINIGINRSL